MSTDTLQGRFQARLDEYPDERAIAWVDAKGNPTWQTYAEFHGAASRCGGTLHAAGLEPKDPCVIVLTSDEFATRAVFGAFLAGARPVLVAPPILKGLHSNLPEVVRHVVKTTGAKHVVVGDEAKKLGEALAGDEGLRVLRGPEGFDEAEPFVAPVDAFAPDELVAFQLTSGTTGFPRVCMWKQHRVLAALDGMEAAMTFSPDDMCLNWTPLYHDMGLVNNFLTCLSKRVPLVMMETLDFLKRPSLWLSAMQTTGANVTWSPNFGFAVAAQRVSEREMEGVSLEHVKAFWNAAERVHYSTLVDFERKFKPFGLRENAIKTNFGCAENVGGATFSLPDERYIVEHVDSKALFEDGEARVVPEGSDGSVAVVGVGKPYPGMNIRILDETGKALPDGRVGEVGLDTPSRFEGYLNDPKETEQALAYGVVRTGDFGYMRDGEMFWVGRVRERINLHGKKFDPSDFEGVINSVDGIREGCFAAFGVDDEKLGTQRLVLVMEQRANIERPVKEIFAELRQKIATELGVTPSEMRLVPQGSMTKTSSGKRRHRFYQGLFERGEIEIVATWKEG